MAFPFTTVLDTFSGGDQNPITTNWTTPMRTGDENIRISGGKIISEFAGGDSSAWYDLATFGPNCEVFATFVDDPVTGDVYNLYLRLQGVGSTLTAGYSLAIVPGATDQWVVFNSVTNVEVGLYESQEVNAGDSIGLRATGNKFQMWYKPSAGVWTRVGTPRTDSTYFTAGYIGVKIQQSGATVVGLDDFGGGNISNYAAEVLSDGPVAYYRMNEPSGFPQDSSGNGNHTTIVQSQGTPNPLYSQPSTVDVGIKLAAVAANGYAFQAIDQPSLRVGDVWTIEAWIKRADTDSSEIVICAKKGGGYYMSLVANMLTIGASEIAIIAQSTTTITDLTTWHHVVTTKNGATCKLYIDAVDVTGTVINTTTIDSINNLSIGVEGVGYPSYFPGWVDEVAIYPTALSADKVLAHYRAGLTIYGPADNAPIGTAGRGAGW